MHHSAIIADSTGGLLHEDGSATLVDVVADLLTILIKGHGHYGNILHHVSAGRWTAVESALRELLLLPGEQQPISPLARNLVTMLHGTTAPNLRAFRPWLLDHVERQTTTLYRRSLERRLDQLALRMRAAQPVTTRSAARRLRAVSKGQG